MQNALVRRAIRRGEDASCKEAAFWPHELCIVEFEARTIYESNCIFFKRARTC